MKRKEFLRSGLVAAGLSALPGALAAKPTPAKRSFRFAFMSDIHVKPGAKPETGMAQA
ncbi:MAG: metallophosphoesterase, partial [Chitinophagaceae bacterium]